MDVTIFSYVSYVFVLGFLLSYSILMSFLWYAAFSSFPLFHPH
jgi:hypothetical protein